MFLKLLIRWVGPNKWTSDLDFIKLEEILGHPELNVRNADQDVCIAVVDHYQQTTKVYDVYIASITTEINVVLIDNLT